MTKAIGLVLFTVLISCTDVVQTDQLPTTHFALVHEHNQTGDWASVIDSAGTELCMFSTEPGEVLDDAHIIEVCGWSAAPAA